MTGTWLRTAQGDLDPLWLLLIAHLALGFLLTLVSMFGGERAFVLAIINNLLSVLILAIIKVPIDRARLLAPALAKGVEKLPTPPYPEMDRDER